MRINCFFHCLSLNTSKVSGFIFSCIVLVRSKISDDTQKLELHQVNEEMKKQATVLLRHGLRDILPKRSLKGPVPLTTERRPELVRGDFARLEDSDVSFFQRILGQGSVLTQDLDAFNIDWLRTCRGRSLSLRVFKSYLEEII